MTMGILCRKNDGARIAMTIEPKHQEVIFMTVAPHQRVGIFVDVQNMFYAAKHLYNSKLNFSRLLDTIAHERPLARAIAYVVQTPEIDQSNFLAMLRSNGYEIRAKDLKQRPDGSAKGDWDM